MYPDVFSVDEFCRVHRISRSLFYKELLSGRGPKIMKVGRRTLISAEAATEWRMQSEEKEERPVQSPSPTLNSPLAATPTMPCPTDKAEKKEVA